MIETVHANLRKLTHSLESCLQKATHKLVIQDKISPEDTEKDPQFELLLITFLPALTHPLSAKQKVFQSYTALIAGHD